MTDNYVVWVGGVPDYEGDNLRQAKLVYKEWVDLGYDDVVIEEGKNND